MSQFQPISDDLLSELLDSDHGAKVGYPAPQQHGPYRRVDKSGRCTSRWCGASTTVKINGMYKCTIHALETLNEMICGRPRLDPSPPLVELGEEPWKHDGTDDGNDFKEPI